MYPLGLTRAQHDAYMDALRASHRIQLDVRIRNRDEEPISALTAPVNQVVAGAVQVDATSDGPSRSLDLTILDPHGKLRFEANSPADGALFADRFISVRYEVWVEDVIADWVSVPVFWGPITGFGRNGAEVTVEAQGKESLLLAPHYALDSYMIQKRTRLDDAIRRVARRAGERRFRLADLSYRLNASRAVGPRDEPWKVIAGGGESRDGEKIAGLIDRGPTPRRAFYDGAGRLVARRAAKKASLTFAEGRDLTSTPEIAYDLAEFRNTVVVHGQKPKGKRPAHARVMLPAKHPLSPQSLARNGELRYMAEFLDTELKTDAACRERGKNRLDRFATATVSPTFSCLPMPHVEEEDLVKLKTDEYVIPFRIRQWTLPLTATDSMTVGANRRVRKWKRRRSGAYRPGR